jgi:hypothetical protein
MCLKEKILRSRFLPFLNDFRYARATIVALCSQGLTNNILKNSSHSYSLILRKMLSVKQKFDRKTINLSLETISTNNKNFTTKMFAPEKSTKNVFS